MSKRGGDEKRMMEGYEEIDAEFLLDQFKTGDKVECDHKIIKGDLDISKLGHREEGNKYHVVSVIKITNSRVDGAIDFSNAVFRNSFDKDVDFTGTTLNGQADFRNVCFCEGANFCNVIFNKSVNFENAKFDTAVFTEARLEGYGNFMNTKFCHGAIFDGIQFNNYANFVGSCFFDAVASFHWACFNDYANFSEAKFVKKANFAKARFRTDANFKNSKFKGPISINDTILNRIYISWESIKDFLEYDDAAYLGLVRNYNNLGLFKDADNCYYQYRTLRRRNHLVGWEQIFDWMAWITYGYGVRPRNPLILILFVFLFSTCVFTYGFGLNQPIGSIINSSYLSAVILTSNPKTEPLTGIYTILGILERIAGWLLMASFLVVLAKKTIR